MTTAEPRVVANLTVALLVDAENLREAEKLFDAWMLAAEDDDRLVSYRVDWSRTDWTLA